MCGSAVRSVVSNNKAAVVCGKAWFSLLLLGEHRRSARLIIANTAETQAT